MLEELLTESIFMSLMKKCSENDITEIHIRANKPIVVFCNTKSYFLTCDGICSNYSQAIYGTYEMIEDIVFKASEYSIYSVNEQIKNGFIMVANGVRLGLCGEVVFDEDIKTIKNFSSICIRLPHQIKNCSLPIFNQIISDEKINSTLIIAPPGAGKTTMIRDLVYQFSFHNYPYNIFIADERGEITGGRQSNINLGNFCDSVCFLNKTESILLGLRSMSPDIIVTDELGADSDFEEVKYAMSSGVGVIATIHARDIEDLKQKQQMKELILNKSFKRYVVLSKENGVGTIEGVYKENLTRIYGGTV